MAHREDEDQSEVFAFLAAPATHGLGPASSHAVKRIDTHGAVVFLAGDHAYKVKRAVAFTFMDFSTLEKRRVACENEIAVNRDNAPDLYLGVIPIRRDAHILRLGEGQGSIIEWVVHLRRFDETKTLDRLAEQGALDRGIIAQLAETIVVAHEKAPVRGDRATAMLRNQLTDTIDGLAAAETLFEPAAVVALRTRLLDAFMANQPMLRRREGDGKVRRCHGDLHLRNIVLKDGRPVLFDAIEFDDSIATIDILYDLAFVLMDLWQRDFRGHANLLLNRYLWRCADSDSELDGLAALPLFLALRAAIRARVTAALGKFDAAQDHSREARRFFAAAVAFLEPRQAQLIAIGGFSGSGKSTLAQDLAPNIGRAPGALHLRSDIERKRLWGVGEFERLPQAAYRPEVSDTIYERLRHMTEIALRGGHSVVVDAVHAKAEERDMLVEVAARSKARFTGLWLDAPRETLVARVNARKHDASDADGAVVAAQCERPIGAVTWQRFDAAQPLVDLVRTSLRMIE